MNVKEFGRPLRNKYSPIPLRVVVHAGAEGHAVVDIKFAEGAIKIDDQMDGLARLRFNGPLESHHKRHIARPGQESNTRRDRWGSRRI